MAISSRQIGWGTEENLLWQISKQLEYLTGVAYNSNNPFFTVYTASNPSDACQNINGTLHNIVLIGGTTVCNSYSIHSQTNDFANNGGDVIYVHSNGGVIEYTVDAAKLDLAYNNAGDCTPC